MLDKIAVHNFQIPGFCKIVKEDFNYVISSLDGTNTRVRDVATRALALGVMACAAYMALTALPIALISALPKLAVAVTLYALGHDVFVMSKNAEREHGPEFSWGFLSNLFKAAVDNALNKNPSNSISMTILKEGTILGPLWEKVLPTVLSAQAS